MEGRDGLRAGGGDPGRALAAGGRGAGSHAARRALGRAGAVFAGGGDITIDHQEAPEYRAAPVEGLAWWQGEDHTCFDAWFYAPDRPAFEATGTACEHELGIDVAVGAGEVEEAFGMLIYSPEDPFFASATD